MVLWEESSGTLVDTLDALIVRFTDFTIDVDSDHHEQGEIHAMSGKFFSMSCWVLHDLVRRKREKN